jgi:hypothetical protein
MAQGSVLKGQLSLSLLRKVTASEQACTSVSALEACAHQGGPYLAARTGQACDLWNDFWKVSDWEQYPHLGFRVHYSLSCWWFLGASLIVVLVIAGWT